MDDYFTLLFAVVTAEDDDDRIWPTLSGPEDTFPIALDELDGENVMHFTASGLNIKRIHTSGNVKDVPILDEHKIVGAITDSRVVFACENFDKGGGWMGFGLAGMAAAATANVVSRARAARRRQGSVLVGQVRYPWLGSVGGYTGRWWSKDQLGLAAKVTKDEGGGGQTVVLQAPEGHGGCHELAAEIARRAAAFRMQYDNFASDSARAELAKLTTATARANKSSKKFASHDLPNAYPVDPVSAFAMNRSLDDAWAVQHPQDESAAEA